MNYDFSDYTVIVTGGTRGIGKAVVEAFLEAGAAVVATYVGDHAKAEELQEVWKDHPLEIVRFNVADYRETEAFYHEFSASHDKLTALVNNAGIRKDSVVAMMPESSWRDVIDTNLTGTYNMSKFAVMKMMENRFGRIINITSPSGHMGFAGQANYASAKAGQVAFSKSLAKEVARKGITVNCVSPGFIETDFIADLTDDLRKEYSMMVPLRRFGQPAEVANGVLFLASPEASYVTGSVLEITGGL